MCTQNWSAHARKHDIKLKNWGERKRKSVQNLSINSNGPSLRRWQIKDEQKIESKNDRMRQNGMDDCKLKMSRSNSIWVMKMRAEWKKRFLKLTSIKTEIGIVSTAFFLLAFVSGRSFSVKSLDFIDIGFFCFTLKLFPLRFRWECAFIPSVVFYWFRNVCYHYLDGSEMPMRLKFVNNCLSSLQDATKIDVFFFSLQNDGFFLFFVNVIAQVRRSPWSERTWLEVQRCCERGIPQ